MITLDEVVARPPVVHGGRTTFGISPELCRFLDASLSPQSVTLETGAGLSTLVILRRGVGAHAFPAPFVDWCYTAEALKVGGWWSSTTCSS